MAITLPTPNLQVNFAYALAEIKTQFLQDALRNTVQNLDIATVDKQLHKYVKSKYLSLLASHGLRAEILFTVPYIIEANPHLVGYYRLLLGYSKKSFYTTETGLIGFDKAEDNGVLSDRQKKLVDEFCNALNSSAYRLIDGLDVEMLNAGFLYDLSLLTLGPQLRGSANVQRGTSANKAVFDIISKIVSKSVVKSEINRIELRNAAKRKVLIEFAADPDIIIREEMTTDNFRNIIAAEIKGGQDYSNIHNRIGEAEKSHQKARKEGFTECWTIVNVDKTDFATLSKESPSTNRFYRLSDLLDTSSKEYIDFRNRIIGLAGIRG